MPSPLQQGLCGFVIARIVVDRLVDGYAGGKIPLIFLVQGHTVVLGMAHAENLGAVIIHDKKNSGLRGLGKNHQVPVRPDLLPVALRPAGMRGHEVVVKAPDQGDSPVLHPVGIDSEKLLRKIVLFDPVVIVKPCLGPPAEVESRGHMALRPFENLFHLGPVVDRLEGHLLDRSPRDDEAVEIALLHVLKRVVELVQVAQGSVLRLMGRRHHEGDIDLQGGI